MYNQCNRNSPQHSGKKVPGKLRSQKAQSVLHSSRHLQYSQSCESNVGSCEGISRDYFNEGEVDLPEPPPLPSVEYLLGKRPANLRKRAMQKSLKEQIKEKVATMGNIDDSYDSDSHSSVGSSQSDQFKRRRRKHKKKKGTENSEEQEIHILQNSPSVVKRASPGLERFPTPFPSMLGNMRFSERMPIQHKIDFDSAFDEVTKELEALARSPPLFSPSPNSPSSSVGSSPANKMVGGKKTLSMGQAQKPHTSTINSKEITATSQKSSKRGGPKLLPHQKNMQDTHSIHQSISTASPSIPEKPQQRTFVGRLSLFGSKKKKQSNPQPQAISGHDAVSLASKDPAQFISVLSQAIKSSPKQTRYMRQASQSGSKSNHTESTPMDIDEIESELNEMKIMLESAADSMESKHSRNPPSPEPTGASGETSDPESDSTEYTSSSDEDTETSATDDSSSEDSSNEEWESKMTSGPKRPIMARNIGMAGSPRARGLGFNRARMLTRYPRLLGRRVVYLDTVEEVPEEIIYLAVS